MSNKIEIEQNSRDSWVVMVITVVAVGVSEIYDKLNMLKGTKYFTGKNHDFSINNNLRNLPKKIEVVVSV